MVRCENDPHWILEIVRNDPGIDFELFRGRIATMNK
jgi:hypothetical protein